jgi:hypothetical protein
MVGKDKIITKILDIEWKMFEKVSSIDGNALCQEDPETFRIMRTSQAVSWSVETLESYLGDLEIAQKDDRNLMTEKYARMMASTSPVEFAKFAHSLPQLALEVPGLIENIVTIILRGELSTYSQKTLELYYDHLSQQESENINGSEITLEHTVKQYGYASLKIANAKLNPSIENN